MSLTVNEDQNAKASKSKATALPTSKDVFAELARISKAHQKKVENEMTEALNYFKQQGGQPGDLALTVENGNVTVRVGAVIVYNFQANPSLSTAMYPDTEEPTPDDMEGAELEANKPKAAKK